MDIRHLKALLVVMETGSLNKAAAQLGISQPALTKSIQRLEALLGAPLFVREAKGMRPTVYAETLRDFARATCVGLEQSITEIRALVSGSSGSVTIGSPPLIAEYLFPEVVVRVRAAFPDLRVTIIEQIDALFESLREGKFDLVTATITGQAPQNGLDGMSLFDEELVVIAKRGHSITRLRPPVTKHLAKCDWILSNAGNLHRKRLEQYFENSNVPMPRPVAETSAPSLMKALVLKSDCIALMAKMGAQAELDAGLLDYVKIDSPLMVRSIGVLWRSNHLLSAATRHVIGTIRTVCLERNHAPRPF